MDSVSDKSNVSECNDKSALDAFLFSKYHSPNLGYCSAQMYLTRPLQLYKIKKLSK